VDSGKAHHGEGRSDPQVQRGEVVAGVFAGMDAAEVDDELQRARVRSGARIGIVTSCAASDSSESHAAEHVWHEA